MRPLRTLNSLAYPDDLADPDLPIEWALGVSNRILQWLWESFQRLSARDFAGINFGVPIDQLERALTQLHCVELQIIIMEQTEGYCSFMAVHECDEFEKISGVGARPPSNDIGLMHRQYRRWIWAVEAKVVPTVATLHDYMIDVDKFRNGIASPVVGEGAAIGYLLNGNPVDFFTNLLTRVAPLEDVNGFPNDRHRCSMHNRNPAPRLRLHHLVMSCN